MVISEITHSDLVIMGESAKEHHCNKISTSQISKCNNAPQHIIATVSTQLINFVFIDFYEYASDLKGYSSDTPIFFNQASQLWYYPIV